MSRPRKSRCIRTNAVVNFYKPQGVCIKNLKEIVLTEVELEAIRLADFEEIEHEEASISMNVSRPTFSRILSLARKKIAEAITNGYALRIEGGDFVVKTKECEEFINNKISLNNYNKNQKNFSSSGLKKRCHNRCIYNKNI